MFPSKSNHMAMDQLFLKPIILITFTLLIDLSIADPPYNVCSITATYTENGSFHNNLKTLLGTFSSNASTSKFHSASLRGSTSLDDVHALCLCLGYVPDEMCRSCVENAASAASTLCGASKRVTVWQELCQLRYSDEDFFGKLDISDNIPLYNKKNNTQPEKFKTVVGEMLRNLTDVAAYGTEEFYAVGETRFIGQAVYGLVQCTKDLTQEVCSKCLEIATSEILDKFYFSKGARLLSKSCYLRYELYSFYEFESEPSSSSGERTKEGLEKKFVFALIAAALVCLIVTVCAACACYKNLEKRNKKREKNGSTVHMSHNNFPLEEQKAAEFPCISFASILAATSNFSDSNMLGRGGFGPVYKGVLRNGKEVAIKRLEFCSNQGSEEFTNEVLLIMKLQHKNLVKLLGFCVDGDEKLLVYEYMPNSSLDAILFNPATGGRLDWTIRKKIVSGIARGTIYLHEDSRLRIIHRDLKASNILLDSNMNPKISDFGIARIFAGSEGQANTATIVGTYGYMAPEYAMEGVYSVKSDVYSFGVLLIEIVSGKRNTGFHRTKLAPCLLSYAWQLWQEGQLMKLMDPLIANSCEPNEFLRYVNIGLLCVQEDASDRPNMSSVVTMLRVGESSNLVKPKRPAFSAGRFSSRADYDHGVDNNCSVNWVTISNVMPR